MSKTKYITVKLTEEEIEFLANLLHEYHQETGDGNHELYEKLTEYEEDSQDIEHKDLD